MKIGIDIDDTIIDEINMRILCAYIFCKMHGKQYCLDRDNDQHIRNLFGWSYDEELEYWSIYGNTIFSLPPRKDAVEFIRRAFVEHEIHFISARTNADMPEIQKFTEKYFTLHNIPYTKLVTGVCDKREYCKRMSIDMFFDDTLSHCENVAFLNIPVFWIITTLNKDKVTSVSKIIRISSFDEVVL